MLLCYLVEFGCVYIKRDGRLNELLGNILGVSTCRRLHGANFCKRLDRADRRSTAGLVEATP